MVSRRPRCAWRWAISPSRRAVHRAHFAQIPSAPDRRCGRSCSACRPPRRPRFPRGRATSPPSGASSSASTTFTPISERHGEGVLGSPRRSPPRRAGTLVQLVHGHVTASLGLLDELLNSRRRSDRATGHPVAAGAFDLRASRPRRRVVLMGCSDIRRPPSRGGAGNGCWLRLSATIRALFKPLLWHPNCLRLDRLPQFVALCLQRHHSGAPAPGAADHAWPTPWLFQRGQMVQDLQSHATTGTWRRRG